MREIGHPVVLDGAARGRVQFGNPRPVEALEFHLPSDAGQFADVVNGALTKWFPGPLQDTLSASADGQTLSGTVQGVEISVGTAPPTLTETVEIDGFTVPARTESLADTAYSLALRTDEKRRGEDLFDLLWGLSETPLTHALRPGPREGLPPAYTKW